MYIRIIVISFLCSLINNNISGQIEVNKSLKFKNQSQIDSFIIKYPLAKVINGGIYIANEKFGDIKSLKAFKNITQINGGLSILYTLDLETLEGFENLNHIESLNITANRNLGDIANLISLNSITNSIKIAGNKSIKSIDIIGSIKPMKSHDIQITGNENLTSLNALDGWQELNSIRIAANEKLINLKGLNNIKTVTGGVHLGPLSNIKNLTDLKQLEHCGMFIFSSMNQIKNLNDLENLRKIESRIEISDNNNLENIDKLKEIEFGQTMEILIGWNKNLSNCLINSYCKFIDNHPTRFIITGNNKNCSIDYYKKQCDIK